MKITLTNAAIIESTIAVQNIVRNDEKNEYKAPFKVAMVMNEKELMKFVEVLYKTVDEKLSEYKSKYAELVSGKEIAGKNTIYGMIQLDMPAELTEELVTNLNELNSEYKDLFAELDELMAVETDVEIIKIATESLPDSITYTEIKVLQYMIKN